MFGAGKILFAGLRYQTVTLNAGSNNYFGAFWYRGFGNNNVFHGSLTGDTSTIHGKDFRRIMYHDSDIQTAGAFDSPAIALTGALESTRSQHFYSIQFSGDSNIYLEADADIAESDPGLGTQTQWSWPNNEHPASWNSSSVSVIIAY